MNRSTVSPNMLQRSQRELLLVNSGVMQYGFSILLAWCPSPSRLM